MLKCLVERGFVCGWSYIHNSAKKDMSDECATLNIDALFKIFLSKSKNPKNIYTPMSIYSPSLSSLTPYASWYLRSR